MTMFLITALVIALVIAAMSVGVMAGRKPISGSCGGIGATGINQNCEICGGDPQRCDEESGSGREGTSGAPKASLFYAADKKQ